MPFAIRPKAARFDFEVDSMARGFGWRSRTKDPRAGREQGRSGLGLTIVRQIAEAHGGEVKLVSQVDHGSAFALWLPALAPAEPQSPLPPPPIAMA